MTEKINEPVSVYLVSDVEKKRVYPKALIWRKRYYPISKVGLKHSFYQGEVLYHVFSVLSQTLFLKLVLNTENLNWYLEEISDGF